MARGAELVLGKEALATPAALDLAFQRGIKIVYRDGASVAQVGPCGCGNASCPGGCTWSKMLAQDGTYVVVISGGKPTISRITPSGPVAFA
jgi:hypothetical protein